MSRVRAMILLFALLCGTGAAVAQTASGSSIKCCTGGMCPVHMRHAELQGKSHGGGMRSSGCPCSIDTSAANEHRIGGTTATHTATLQRRSTMAALKSSRNAPGEFSIRIRSGYDFSSEHPPRVADQDNS